MTAARADLRIEVRWIAPMTVRDELLEDHSLVVRDGRIIDILPSAAARERYFATAVVRRTSHLLMPGMINTRSDAAMLLLRGMHGAQVRCRVDAQFTHDCVTAAIAEMLKSGITCFSDHHYFPGQTAHAADEQGIRAVIGMPVAEAATPWAQSAAQSLTQSLDLRDEYRGHRLISTVFAPHAGNRVSDETFSRLATLADELDAGIQMDLHASAAEMEECAALYGMRPIERLRKLGLLTPALNAVHMAHATAADIELARRTGISISLCPQSNLRSGALPPVAALAAAGVQLGLGSAGAASLSQGVWGEMKLTALLSLTPWDVLCSATRGGAAALGIADEVGTLETGKSADLCCIDLSGPAAQPPQDPLTQLVFNGGRDIVGDVWVAGRQLLAGGELCRLDWSAAAASFGAKYA